MSTACLSFFSKLMDFARNKQARIFRELFCKIDVQFIREVGFDKHILLKMDSDSVALQIVDVYIKGVKTENQQTVSVPMLPAVVIKNSRAVKAYNTWKTKQKLINRNVMNRSFGPTDRNMFDDDKNGWNVDYDDTEEDRALAESL